MCKSGLTNLTISQLNEIVDKLGGDEEALRFLDRKWYRIKGIIYLSLVSDGTTGKQWVEYFESNGIYVGEDVKEMLLSKSFTSTNGVTYEIAILTRRLLIDLNNFKEIYDYAKESQLSMLNAEAACLLRKNLFDNDLDDMEITYITTVDMDSRYTFQVGHSFSCEDEPDQNPWLDGSVNNFERGLTDNYEGFACAVKIF